MRPTAKGPPKRKLRAQKRQKIAPPVKKLPAQMQQGQTPRAQMQQTQATKRPLLQSLLLRALRI